MIIDCISDLHGYFPSLPGGDLLIIAGDLTANDIPIDYDRFNSWLKKQDYKCKILVAGNHDNILQKFPHRIKHKDGGRFSGCDHYLCDSGTEFEGLKIWGSPWTKTFEGMNPKCKAFTCDHEDALAEKWKLIPHDVDILITHGPPYGVLDWNDKMEHCGSLSLYNPLYSEKIKPKLHCFGHIHEAYGHIEKMLDFPYTQFVNCSYVNERYEPVNNPIRIVLSVKKENLSGFVKSTVNC